MEDLTGKQFGAYQIVGPLGEGGMAAVYKAYQPAMERYVALKVLPRHFANDPQFTARFQQEAKLLAQLQHPHILPVFDYGQSDGYTYIAMPFVQSGTLADSLQGQPLPLARICQVITQVGEALNYAHTRGLIHRDVKPGNVLIDESGNCLLTDFGLARMVEESVKLTNSGAIVGTPAYMSPEQGSGQKLDARSDIYSLGIILYEMVTGRVPYRAETPIAVIFKHIQDPLPPVHTLNPNLPEAVELVVLKALSKNPEDRYPTAGDMARSLQASLAETPPAPRSSTLPPSPPPEDPPVKKRPAGRAACFWGLLGTAAVIGIVGFLAVSVIGISLFNQKPANNLPLGSQPTASPVNELVPDWSAIGGSWSGPDEKGIVHGKAAAFDGDSLYLFKNSYTDFWFSVKAQAVNREASLAIRMSDDGKNGYLVIFIPQGSRGGNPGLWLAKRVNGDHSYPASSKVNYDLGEWVQITVEAYGTRVKVSLNGDLMIDFNDEEAPFTSGRLGFRCYGESTAPCEANFAEFYMSH